MTANVISYVMYLLADAIAGTPTRIFTGMIGCGHTRYGVATPDAIDNGRCRVLFLC
jgi:hypothetical protein